MAGVSRGRAGAGVNPQPCSCRGLDTGWHHAGTKNAVQVKIKCSHFGGQIKVCWALAFLPIGFWKHHAEGCQPPWAHLSTGSASACLVLTVLALEEEVGSGLGWDALNLLPCFRSELAGAMRKGCPAPHVPEDRLGTQPHPSLLQGWKLNVEPGCSWRCICFLHYPFKLFKPMFSKILKKNELC